MLLTSLCIDTINMRAVTKSFAFYVSFGKPRVGKVLHESSIDHDVGESFLCALRGRLHLFLEGFGSA